MQTESLCDFSDTVHFCAHLFNTVQSVPTLGPHCSECKKREKYQIHCNKHLFNNLKTTVQAQMRPTSVVEKCIDTKLHVKNMFQAQIIPTSVVEKFMNFMLKT